MANKKQLLEELNRFNKNIDYNPSKGTINEEGEQTSMDFPVELTSEEQRVSDMLDAMLVFMEDNVENKSDGYFYDRTINGHYGIKNYIDVVKSQLRGDAQREYKGYGQEKDDKLGRQQVMDFTGGEINTLEEFMTLLDNIITSLGNLNINYDEIRRLKDFIEFRETKKKEEPWQFDDDLPGPWSDEDSVED